MEEIEISFVSRDMKYNINVVRHLCTIQIYYIDNKIFIYGNTFVRVLINMQGCV